MKRFKLTKEQKAHLSYRAFFWLTHIGHWTTVLVMSVITLSLLYTFWGNDAAFAAVILGR